MVGSSSAISSPERFFTDGIETAATLWLPAGTTEPVAGVVTGPGFGGVKEMLIPTFAAHLAAAGIACLAFDPVGFGESAGPRRQHVDPPQQLRSFHAALAHLAADARIDPRRLGVWGTSLAGGHTLRCAATDPRVRAAAALIPFIAFRNAPDPRIAARTTLEVPRRLARRPDRVLPIAGFPGTVAAMTSDGALDWIDDVTASAPNYRNAVTVASLLNMTRYSTARAARGVAVPTLVILAEDDTITPARQVRRAVRGNPNVEVVSYPDSHFELFTTQLGPVADQTAQFFARHLD